jgi:membrane protein implicated in regulation of membrane protease activity
MSTVFWAWVIFAVICALLESINADMFMLPWSAGGAAAAVLEVLHVSMGWQWVAFFGLPTAILIAVQRARRSRERAESGPRGGGPLS